MQLQNQLFTEQLRPKTLEQAILLPRIKAELSKGLVDNIMFTSGPGTGKCLHYDETIEIYVDSKLARKIKKFLKTT